MIKNTFHSTKHPRSKGIKTEIRNYKKRMRLISTVTTLIIVFSFTVLISYYLSSLFTGSDSLTNKNSNHSSSNPLKAALIDALYTTHPNDNFTKSINETLREAGFKVDIFQGTEVTVNFLKKLPNGYKLIILRMHSALSTDNQLYLFTAEPYSTGKYTQEQYFQLVKEAYATEDSQHVFAVNWGFIKRCMAGKFNGTLVIAMGCDGTLDPWIAKEFLNQGAVGYIAWTGPVSLTHSDKAVLFLIQALYIEKLPLEQAVKKTNSQIGKDPNCGTVLDFYVP